MKKKILITGVAGMIGSHLAKALLESGYSVAGIDNLSIGKIENMQVFYGHPDFTFFDCSLSDIDWSDSNFKDTDCLVHLAAHKKIIEAQESIPLFQTNVEESSRIIKFCTNNRTNLIFASTSDVYGYGTAIPFTESDDIRLGSSSGKRWAYATSKLYVEHLIQGYVKEQGLNACILRYFGGFSEKASFSWSGGHIPIFIDAILRNKEIVIHGDGMQTRSIGHADDLARGTLLAIHKMPDISGEVINVGNDEEISILDSVYKLADLLEVDRADLNISFVDEQTVFGTYRDIRRRQPNLEKAQLLLGYKPEISFEQSVKRVLEVLDVSRSI